MSVYAVHKLCRQVHHDPGLREQLRTDPASTLAQWDLTEEERHALLAGDVARLYRAGCHGFLLYYLARHELFGLTDPLYRAKLQAVQSA